MPKVKLTKKRRAWVEPRRNVKIEGTRLVYNAAVQQKYRAALDRLIKKMTDETSRKILKLFRSETAKDFYIAQDANISSQARILTNKLIDKFNSLFAAIAKPLAESVVNNTDKVSQSAVHQSLKKLSGGLSIKTRFISEDMKTMMKAAVAENMALIKSIPADYLSRVQKKVFRSITTGQGAPSVEEDLTKYKGISERKAKMISLDQTRKLYNQLNAQRMEKVGLDNFVWRHSGGGLKPRQEHIDMDGDTYSISDPPIIDSATGERGLPGQLPNCGCTMVPVIEFNTGEQEE